MGVTVNIYSIISSLLALTALVVALLIERDEHFPARTWMTLALIANGILVGAQALEYASRSLWWMIFWDRFQYLGFVLLPGAYLFTVLEVMGRNFCINKKSFSILAVGVIGELFLVASDRRLHWLVQEFNLFRIGQDVFLAKESAWGETIFLMYGLAALLAGSGIILWYQQYQPATYRRHGWVLLVTALLPAPLILLVHAGISPWSHLAVEEVGIALSTLLLAWNLRAMKDQDLRLTGRWAALDTLRDPILVLDERDYIIDLNPAALNSLGVTRQDILRRNLADLWPDLVSEIARRQGLYHDQTLQFTWEKSPDQPLQVEINPLYDRRNRILSKLIQLKPGNDTVNIEAELQRLALELRNDQYVSEALLSLEPLPVVLNRVAGSLLSNYRLRLVWIARYIPEYHRLELLALRNDLSPEAERQLWIIFGQLPSQKTATQQLPRLECGQDGFPVCKKLFDQAQVMRGSLRELLEPWVASMELEKFAEATGIGACLHAPIKVGSELLGTIFVAGQGSACLQPQMNASLRRVATQVAVVLENHRLQADERRRSDELAHSRDMLAALSHVATRLEAIVDQTQVMKTLGEELGKLGMGCLITHYLPDQDCVRMRYLSVQSDIFNLIEHLIGRSFYNYRIPVASGDMRTLLYKRQPLYIPRVIEQAGDYLQDIPPNIIQQVLDLVGIQPNWGTISVPLIVADQVYGVLTIWGGDIGMGDIPTVLVFGKQVSLALQNSRLYLQIQERAEALAHSRNMIATLSQVAARLEAAVEPEQIMRTLGEELRRLEMHCMISTYDAPAEILHLQYIFEKPAVIAGLERVTGMSFRDYKPPANLPGLDLPLKNRQPLFIRNISDIAAHYLPGIPPARLRKVLELIGIKPGDSTISLPLIVDGEVYGLFTLWGGEIEESDIPALGVFGKQVSLALQNSYLYQQVHERADALARSNNLIATLSQAAVRMETARQPKQILAALGAELKLLHLDCFVAEYHAETGGLIPAYLSLMPELVAMAETLSGIKMSTYRLPASIPAVQRVIESRQASYLPDAHPYASLAIPGVPKRLAERAFSLLGFKPGVPTAYLPLLVTDKIYGLVIIWGQDLLESDMPAMEVFARQVSAALENALLNAETDRQLSHQKILRKVSDLLNSSLDGPTVLRRLAEQIVLAIDATSAMIYAPEADPQAINVLVDHMTGNAAGSERTARPENLLSFRAGRLQELPAEGVQFRADSTGLQAAERDLLKERGALAALRVPLRHPRRQAVEFILWESRYRRVFTPEEEALCRSIIRQAEIALEKAELFSKAQQSEQDYRGLFENAHDAILIFSPENERILEVNQRACEVYGFSRDEFLRMSLRDISVDSHGLRRQILDSLQSGRLHKYETRQRKKNGAEMHLEVNASLVDYQGQKAIQSINRDVTERVENEIRLNYAASHDSLTHLPNRAELNKRLAQAIARFRRSSKQLFAVLFLDLDSFKDINDTRGHLLGDRLLIEVARRLDSHLRRTDMVARLGGDEFVILLEDIEAVGDVSGMCERVLKEIAQPIHLNNEALYITTSIGVVLSDPAYQEPQEYLRDADIAMYRAKNSGRNRFEFFDATMREQVLRRLTLESDVRQALQRNEFFLEYMPIVELNSGRLTGMEALVRWRHPQRGVISPLEFIPVAEETGLIISLGRWILAEACRQAAEWEIDYPYTQHMQISVNLAGEQITQNRMAAEVQTILRETGLAAERLCLEVTESVLIEDVGSAQNTLRNLKAMGIRIHLDDFGTGYSSLSYLHKFPIDGIKIDRSFIQVLDPVERNGGLVRTIIMMGRDLGMRVIAEGVETAGQALTLRSIGCDLGQGYYFSRPLQASAAEALLANLPANMIQSRFQLPEPGWYVDAGRLSAPKPISGRSLSGSGAHSD